MSQQHPGLSHSIPQQTAEIGTFCACHPHPLMPLPVQLAEALETTVTSATRQRERESAHRGKATGELPNCLLMFCLPTQEKESKGWEQTFLPFLPCISSSRPTASCFCGPE